MADVAIALREITRRFGETIALDRVSLDIRRGEILCLLGENGAGKTTLMRIAAGVDAPSEGTLTIDGASYAAMSSELAARLGISLVHQHFLLVPDMSIAENLAIPAPSTPPLLSKRLLVDAALEAATRCGLSLGDVTRQVSSLSVGEMSRVELVKALRRNPRVLILDEPTSVLSPPEVEELGRALRRLSAEGTAIVLITHKLAEVFAFADRVAVLRAGHLVHDGARESMTQTELARIMTGGRDIAVVTPDQQRATTGGVLAMTAVSSADGKVHDAQLTVGGGEIVAIVGVAGNGQRELAQLLRGLAPFEGSVELLGVRSGQRALAQSESVAHVPEDRSSDGICGELTIEENIALSNLSHAPHFSIRAWQRAAAEKAIASFSIRARNSQQTLSTLSGGNQQKVILARELAHRPHLIVAAEPTRGLDLDATAFVHAQLQSATQSGAGVLLLTTDLDEAFELADAIHVIYRGTLSERISKPFSADDIGERMAGVR